MAVGKVGGNAVNMILGCMKGSIVFVRSIVWI